MARTNNLSNFLTDVADAIRTKKGSEELIAAENFDTEIENLPSGADLSEYFNNTISENTSTSFKFNVVKKVPDVVVENNVTKLEYLFYNYTMPSSIMNNLPKVICGNNVTSMYNMYYTNSKDTKITSIDISGLDTSNVTTMSNMFKNRAGLVSLDFSNFDFSSLKTASSMFSYCEALTNLDLSKLIGTSFTTNSFGLEGAFEYCSSLRKIDLSNFSPPVIYARSMFYNCLKLEELDLDKWDLGTVGPALTNSMFSGCGSQLENGAVTKVYVKDQAAQDWILALSSSNRPSTWTTDNVIIAGSEADLRNA